MNLIKYFQPKFMKHQNHRNKLNLPKVLPSELSFKIASTENEYEVAFKILYESYLEKGYDIPNKFNLRVTPYHLIPNTTVILALWNNEIIGTISLVRDNPLGLPLEKVFNLDHLRVNNNIMCEISALAIKKEYRGKQGEILFPLIRYMWTYAYKYFGVDYFVIAVNPAMYELYESIFLFQSLKNKNKTSSYSFANNNPAVGQFINLKSSYELFRSTYKDMPFEKNLSLFMEQELDSKHQFPERNYFSHLDSPVTPKWVSRFSEYISTQNHPPHTLNHIANSFGFKTATEMFNEDSNYKRLRIPVSFNVINFPDSKIVDISEKGLKLISNHPISMDSSLLLRCKINRDTFVTIISKPVWKNNENVYGLQIISESEAWNTMIRSLNPIQPLMFRKSS